MTKKVRNTALEPNHEWLFGKDPLKIEIQETMAQRELLASSQLPVEVNTPRGANAKAMYAAIGIKVIGITKDDDIFYDVEMPKGWHLNGTGHSMWNDLLDDKGRKRASIFHKGAFYDRSAFINFNHRYGVRAHDFVTKEEKIAKGIDPNVRRDSYAERNECEYYCDVIDHDGKVIFTTERVMFTEPYPLIGVEARDWKKGDDKKHYGWWERYEKMKKSLREQCISWLNKNFPDWENAGKYWDEQ